MRARFFRSLVSLLVLSALLLGCVAVPATPGAVPAAQPAPARHIETQIPVEIPVSRSTWWTRSSAIVW